MVKEQLLIAKTWARTGTNLLYEYSAMFNVTING